MESKSFKKILIVDDALILKPIWEVYLKSLNKNIQISWSISYEHAIVLIDREIKNGQVFDLMIVDIFLSGRRTGIDLIESELVKKNRINSIIITSSSIEQVKAEYKPLVSENSVFSKPINFSHITPTILKYLEKEQC